MNAEQKASESSSEFQVDERLAKQIFGVLQRRCLTARALKSLRVSY